jgi:hypothetical protein
MQYHKYSLEELEEMLAVIPARAEETKRSQLLLMLELPLTQTSELFLQVKMWLESLT